MAELTLVLETADGTVVRRIPDASPLPEMGEQGYEVENASRRAASMFGMPDFLFLPKQQRNGSGMRELGDGIVVVGLVLRSCRSKAEERPATTRRGSQLGLPRTSIRRTGRRMEPSDV
jgi:hypothetical protein